MATKQSSILTLLAAIIVTERQDHQKARVDLTAFAAAYLTVVRLGY